MSGFRPTRTSPPSKLTSLADSLLNSTLSTDLSRSSSVSIKELVGLTPEEVELLDAILLRAGSSATTFPAVFAAYNVVLKERGLDPSEVVFYGKLLKLGTLKGGNWGEKWRMVKVQQGYSNVPQSSRQATGAVLNPTRNVPTRLTRPQSRVFRPTDSPTLFSREEDGTDLASETESVSVDVPQYHLLKRPAMLRPASPIYSEATSASLDVRTRPLPSSNIRPRLTPPPRRQMPETDTSNATEDPGAPSIIAPSLHRTAGRDHPPARTGINPPKSSSPPKRPSSSSLATARQVVAQARERKGSVVNEEDAWKKIKMIQYEKEADAFRRDKLVERCWDVWKRGSQWITTTHRQIGEARENLILGQAVHRWRIRTADAKDRFEWVANQEKLRRVQATFRIWREKTKERKLAKWRASLRSKMKIVRDKRELKLMRDALAKWRRAFQIYFADRQYSRSLLIKCYEHWRKRLAHLDQLDDVADRVLRAAEGASLQKSWNHWKHASQLQLVYKVVTDNIGLRIKTEVMDVWMKQMRDNHQADGYYDIVLTKRIFGSWKTARDRIRSLESRAAAHERLQDRRLLHVMYMIMRARYQKRRLEVIADSGRLKEAWAIWKTRMKQRRNLEETAVSFSLRTNSPLAKTALQRWRQAYSVHKNLETVAVFHHSKSLLRRASLAWRITLHNKHNSMSKARAVDKFLVTRSAWNQLRVKYAERRREHALKALELRKMRNIFCEWFERASRRRAQRFAEHRIQANIRQRILAFSLARWTNRTIEVKNRELQATIDLDTRLIKFAFKKWRLAHAHHAFVDGLMESYALVKREDLLKKTFHRWLSATRTARHRRLTLDRKESEMEFGYLSVAWDKWRERFRQQRLQPIEYDVILQTHKNLLTRMFRLWYSKTKSLPAIRFNASRIKRVQNHCWKIWREALPRALQMKTAREMEKTIVLTKFFDKWLQAHRTKVALKAVARARYLRLPPPPIRSTPNSKLPAATPITSRNLFPRRLVKAQEQTSEDEEEPKPGPSWRRGNPAGPKSFRSESPPRRSQSRFSIPGTRASSPARSTFGLRPSRDSTVFPTRHASSVTAEVKPSSLLREFRQLQRRPRSPSEHSRRTEPP